MDFLSRNYDRVLAVIMGVILLSLGFLAVNKALGLKDLFPDRTLSGSNDLGANSEDAVKLATEHLTKDIRWETPSMPGVPQKPLPLTRSVPVWAKQGGLEIDLLDPTSPKIRPPLDNDWAFKHNLDVGRTDLLSLDEDGDGFTTQQEFESGKTDPNDSNSHPDFSNKLSLLEIKEDTYALVYRTGDSPEGEFGIREEATRYEADPPRVPPRRKSHFLKINTQFGTHPGHQDRYAITGFEKRTVPGTTPGLDKAAHRLTISDAVAGEPFVLEYRNPRIIKTYFAVFYYDLDGNEAKIGPLKVGGTFTLPNDPGTTYEVIELKGQMADGAKIRQKSPEGTTPKDISIFPGAAPEATPEATTEEVTP